MADTLPALAGQAAIAAARLPLLALRAVSTNILRATDGRDVLFNDPDGWEVEQPYLWWTGPAGSNGAGGGPWGNPIPGAEPWVPFGGIPAVARSTSLIVDTLAALPWKVYRGTEQLPTPDWITDPQGLRFDGRVVDPSVTNDTRWSRMDVWTQWLTSALWLGDAYLYVPRRDVEGMPKPPLFVLPPDSITIKDGRYWFGEAGDTAEHDSDGLREVGRPFASGEIIHMRGIEPITGGHGTGVLRRFVPELRFGLSLSAYAAGVFQQGVPAGYLKVTQPHLDQEAANSLKAGWMAAHGGTQRGIAVLNATTDFHALTFTPVDANLVGVSEGFIRQVALMFGVPPYMLGVSAGSETYANIESRMIELARFTLLPWAARAEDVLSAQFPRGTSVKIALDGVMRADTATRYAAYKIALEGGWLTSDEVRALEDRAPLAEAVAP